jgi:hypothetical protein
VSADGWRIHRSFVEVGIPLIKECGFVAVFLVVEDRNEPKRLGGAGEGSTLSADSSRTNRGFIEGRYSFWKGVWLCSFVSGGRRQERAQKSRRR